MSTSVALKKLFYFSNVFIFPLRQTSRRFRVCPLRTLSSFLVVGALFCVGLQLFLSNRYIFDEGNSWIYFKLHIVAHFIFLPVSVVLMLANHPILNFIYGGLVRFDKVFGEFFWVPRIFVPCLRFLGLIILFAVYFLHVCILSILNIDCTYSEIFFLASNFLSLVLLTYQIYGLLYLIGHRLQILTTILTIEQVKLSIRTVLKLTDLYLLLCKLCLACNKLYSLQLLAMIYIIFVTWLMNFYYLFDEFFISEDTLSMRILLSIEYCLWLINSSYVLWILISSHERVRYQAKEFNKVLFQIMLDDKTNEISNNKKLRLHMAMKREIVFSPCGFFTLDYTLVHSMVAAATTYLVVLIQFGSTDVPTPSNATITTP